MSFSALTSKTQAQYDELSTTLGGGSPTLTKSSGINPSVTIRFKGWVSETVMAFSVLQANNTLANLSIVNETIQVDLSSSGITGTTSTYWTMDAGSGFRAGDWTLTFDVRLNNSSTGTWVFKKGTTNDPDL